MYKIEVRKPLKITELRFRTFKNSNGRFMIEIYDNLDRKTAVSFDKVSTQTPSTLLSRWSNYFLYKELLSLSGKGSSVEYQNGNSSVENEWKFRDEVTLFGLHDTVNKKGVVKKVSIDDSIGMKNVVAILKSIGYTVETEYDSKTNRMLKISLIKE
ncbi:hypothetical protein vB_AbaM_Acibel004_154 [Acinetobacter phage vB_AbaM_Acibel004]|uniref:hypothetical protein n=1 Tax=Acinetobacter phage vB_AbaM_Acibel004 TaxID=1481186 RepID=UPI0004E8362F|nr:hypothetical protein vB_AbaM_Acibel004_154 [Acinetobacter phage vB_AbaM_Acibel004]AHY26769.1 hypothetical protein vB_AbaM_Acibel004_154 [Acinetobacter phage vB_AbaM_Acibel004]